MSCTQATAVWRWSVICILVTHYKLFLLFLHFGTRHLYIKPLRVMYAHTGEGVKLARPNSRTLARLPQALPSPCSGPRTKSDALNGPTPLSRRALSAAARAVPACMRARLSQALQLLASYLGSERTRLWRALLPTLHGCYRG